MIAAEVTNGYLRDLPFTLMYLVDADGKHARLAAHSGLGVGAREHCAGGGVARCRAGRDDVGHRWRRRRNRPSLKTLHAGADRRRTCAIRRFSPQVAITVPLADPSGGVGGVLVIGTNPMRPAAEGAPHVERRRLRGSPPPSLMRR